VNQHSYPNTKEVRHHFRAVVVAGAIAAICLAMAACSSSSSPAGGSGADATELRLGYFANLTHSLPLIGVQDGEYQKALGATKLTTQIFNAGPAAIEALNAGAIDAAYVGPSPAVNAFSKSDGAAIRIVSGAASGGAELVVQAGITSAAQLKGKTVATPQLGGTQDVALRYWLKQQALTAPISGTGDVTVVSQDNSQTFDQFKQGTIAGAWLPEPWASRLVIEGGGKVLVNENSLWPQGRFATTELIVATSFLRAHPDTISKLLTGELDTLKVINADPAAAQVIANSALKSLTGKSLKENVIARAWESLTLTVDPVAATLQASLDHGIAVGTTKPVDLKGIYDLSLLNALLRQDRQPTVSADGLGTE
jgi:NitT/TauT family transport system substrate-binding protein